LQADKMLEGLHVQFLMEYPSKALELAQLMPIIGMLSIDKYMQIEKITTEEVACFTKLSQAGIPLVEQLLLLVHHLENPTTLTDALILLKMKQLYEVIEKKFDLGYKTMTKISACILILEQVSPDFITERNISIILRCKNITGILEALLPFDKNCLPPEPFCAKPRNIFGWRVPTAGERKYEALKRFLEKLSKMDESTVDEEVTTLLQPNPTANLESYSDEEDGVQGACRLI